MAENENPYTAPKLMQRLHDTVAMRDHRQADREREFVSTAALVGILGSLEGNTVPAHWEALEGPSGAILGWFDPQVARAIAQALGATQSRQDGTEPEGDDLLIEVGSLVVLTAMAEQAESMGDITAVGQVTELGESEGAVWAWVVWGTEPDGTVDEGKVWTAELTVVGHERDGIAEVSPVDEQGNPLSADELARINAEADMLGDPTEVAGVTSDGMVIEPDDEPAPAPDPVSDELVDDIDADFDTVVDTTPAPDGLAAIRKGKGKGGK